MKEQLGAQFTRLGVALLPMAERLMTPLNAALSKAGDWVDVLIARLTAVRPYINQLAQPFVSLFRRFQSSLAGLSDYLTPVAELIEQRIYPIALQLWTAASDIIGDIVEFVSQSELLKDIFSFVAGIVSSIGDMLSGLASAVQWLWNTIIMPLLNGIERAYRWLKGSEMPAGSNLPVTATPAVAVAPDTPDHTTERKLEQIADNTRRNADIGTKTANAVASAGPKVVNINVTKFFDNICFTTNNLSESAAQVEQTVLEVLSRVLVQGAANA